MLTIAGAGLGLPAAAAAKLSEIGDPAAQGTPSCPNNPCQVLSRTTGYQVRGNVRDPYLVPRAGSLVAFTIALGKPSKSQIKYFDSNLGGSASVRVTVLRPFARRRNNYRFVVKGQSELFGLVPYFGQTVQFAFSRSLRVKKNDLVALTVPTWAPALALGLDNGTTWRSSRPKPCSDSEAFQQFAQERYNAMTQYACEYKTARMTYSATLVSTP